MMMQDVPPAHRFIEAIVPGFMFGDSTVLKCPGREWIDAEDAAMFVSKKSENFVAYRRFAYYPECEKKAYMDPGWVYFKGCKIDKDDIISKKAENKFQGLKIGDILRMNVENNRVDVIWLKEYDTFYPFYNEDVFVDINERRKS